MANNVEELLDLLYEMIDEAKNVPLSSDKCMVEREKALDILDDARARFPVELKKAKDLMTNKNDYIASAKREADAIRQKAEDHVKRILSEDSVVVEAKRRAEEMVAAAEEQSRQIRRAANEYCEETLRRMEEAVADTYDEVKNSRARFRSALGAGGPVSRVMYDAEEDDV